MDMAYLNQRLELTARGMIWTQGKWTEGKQAGCAKGLVSLNGTKYTKDSVANALSSQDVAVLVPAKEAKAAEEAKAQAEANDLTTDRAFVATEAKYLAAAIALEEAKAALQDAKAELVAYAEDGDIRGNRFTVKKHSRRGNVSYKSVVTDLIPSVDLEPYRGEQVEYFMVRPLAK
jgi:hypothetical protein